MCTKSRYTLGDLLGKYVRYFIFTCLLYVIVRMNMYVMYLLWQWRLNKLIIIIGMTREVCERDMGMTREVCERYGDDKGSM